ncbi:MAG: SGNH/GDSL hydrolase family protein [Actinotalea sp.]|nr:SGNH/GDSL hydrolase family protein [Actinotalea sp.]
MGPARQRSPAGPPDTSPIETATPAPRTTTDAGATTDPDTIQLLYISDSSGWKVGEAYRELAERELGVPVELVDWRFGGFTMTAARDLVRSGRMAVADAEIVVVWANPLGSGVKEGVDRCVGGPYEDPGVYTVADWEPFADVAAELLDDVWEARAGRPTVVRVTDLYTPVLTDWERHGIREACLTAFETMSDALREVAESHGATFVSALDVYNGPDHQRDPVAEGLIDVDGTHPSEAGAQAMAEALAAAGFEPSVGP